MISRGPQPEETRLSMSTTHLIETPLDRLQLSQRWQAMCADPTFDDVPGKVELNERGEILMSPVGKAHALTATRIVVVLEGSLPGRTMVEVGILTSAGIRAPDVAWCSDAWLAAHPEESPLTSAPELCIEIASPGNALPELREEARAYVEAGAREAWIVFPADRSVEVHSAAGRVESSSFPVSIPDLFVP
jgi:Uma2 family endonuclease